MTYPFAYGFIVTESDGSFVVPARLDSLVGALMNEMVGSETKSAFDSSVGATLAEAEVNVEIVVASSDPVSAASAARTFVVAAIRAIGGEPSGLFAFPNGSTLSGDRHVWHERSTEVTQQVSVGPQGSPELAIALDARGFRWVPHKNKYGKDYPTNAGRERY